MVDTRPAASRWRGSAVREPPARPLKPGAIDLAGPPFSKAPARKPAPLLALLAALAAILALATAVIVTASLHGPPAATQGDSPP